MNVSKISNISFGQVKGSAAQRAVKDANGNYETLEHIRDIVKKQQENDKYDIMSLPLSTYGYIVVKRKDGKCENVSYNLKDAAACATELAQQYYTNSNKAVEPANELEQEIFQMVGYN